MTSGHRHRRPHRQPRRHQQQQRRRRRHRWLTTVARSSREVRAQVEKRCDFLFATGRYVQRPQKTEQDWAGLFSALPDILENTASKEETYKSESAVTAAEGTTTSTANKLEITKTATSKTTSTT